MMNCDEKQMKETACVSCGNKEVKYRCPSCSRRTCSLKCVKEHKKTYSCNGKRCITSYVSRLDYNYNNMINDYRLLEDTERVAYSAGSDNKQRPRHLNRSAMMLLKKARQSGVVLKLMPTGMSKRKMNSSHFNYKNKCIMWRVRLFFPQADSEYVNKRVSEEKVLVDFLKHYIDPTESDPIIRQRLKPYLQTPADEVLVFMKVEYQPANKERYYKLDPLKSLKENLAGKTIIEFPTLHIVLPDKADTYQVEMGDKLNQIRQGKSKQQSTLDGEYGKLEGKNNDIEIDTTSDNKSNEKNNNVSEFSDISMDEKQEKTLDGEDNQLLDNKDDDYALDKMDVKSNENIKEV